MKILKLIFRFTSLIIGALLILFAGYTYILESSPLHTADYFGLVFTLGAGIPGMILLTLGISLLKQRRVLFTIFGGLFLFIFFISLIELFTVASSMWGQIFSFGICWLMAGIGYILSAHFIRNKDVK